MLHCIYAFLSVSIERTAYCHTSPTWAKTVINDRTETFTCNFFEPRDFYYTCRCLALRMAKR